jgi:hypothetical protein
VEGSRARIWGQTHLGTDLSSKGHSLFSLWGNNSICDLQSFNLYFILNHMERLKEQTKMHSVIFLSHP